MSIGLILIILLVIFLLGGFSGRFGGYGYGYGHGGIASSNHPHHPRRAAADRHGFDLTNASANAAGTRAADALVRGTRGEKRKSQSLATVRRLCA